MTRLAPAVEQFIEEVQETFPGAEVEPFGDPDGFGITRTVILDSKTSKSLDPAMEYVGTDNRIEGHSTQKGRLVVEFSPTHRADWRTPFSLAALMEAVEEVSKEQKKREAEDEKKS